MRSRTSLHSMLVEAFGSNRVYYQTPENFKMEYPALRYSKSDIISRNADDIKYSAYTRYEIIIIDKKPDNISLNKILSMPLSSYDRHYVSDGLHHDVITLYY